MGLHTVLIVDDSSTSRMIIRRCFEMAGYTAEKFLFAASGREGLETAMKERDIGLIITDINMPEMDGPTFIRKLKEERGDRAIPVCVVSSIGDGTELRGLQAHDILGVVKKPVTPEKFRHLLGERYE